jgi:hypothetical protein
MRDDRPFISLNEIGLNLPSHSVSWDAETATAWSASRLGTDIGYQQVESLATVLEKLFIYPGVAVGTIKDDYQRFLVMKTLLRLMWSYKEQTTHPAARFMPSFSANVAAKTELARVIDEFYFSPILERVMLQDGFALRMQQFYDIQLSHILTADDVWDHLHLIWRPHPKGAEARLYISKWMQQSPRTCRNFIRANAQLLNAARMWPDNHPQEAYNCFHAGMALWVMSLLGKDLPMYSAFHEEQACSLDWFGSPDAIEADRLRDWVETGVPCYTVRMHGVPSLFHPDAPEQVLEQTANVLRAMSVWAVAHTFMNATIRTLKAKE